MKIHFIVLSFFHFDWKSLWSNQLLLSNLIKCKKYCLLQIMSNTGWLEAYMAETKTKSPHFASLIPLSLVPFALNHLTIVLSL